jgi:pimeloyl-ACP methyl ester carboxylesterase
MERARIDGRELSYEVVGSGDPVLLISTGPITDSFAPLVTEEAMVGRFRSIRYRQRRLRGGTFAPAPVSFAEHAADAAALLRHLGVRRAHVAGHSTGACIALQLALDHPELVHTLTLLEPPLLGVPSSAAFLANARPAIAAYAAGDHEGAMAGFLSMVCSLDWETCRAQVEQRIPGAVVQAMSDADDFFGSFLPALGSWQFGSEKAAAISQPVLSVVGTETERLFAESHELLRAWLPQLETHEIPDVAHLLHLQSPGPVARGVAEFLARHPIASDRSGATRASRASA